MLSRNFRLQRVGNLEWLQKNYNFAHISFFIDELIVLDVTRAERNIDAFCDTLKQITAGCFVPIAAGGGVRSIEQASKLLRSGADKIVLNSPLFGDLELINNLSKEFGQQCLVGSVDMKRQADKSYKIYINSGTKPLDIPINAALSWIESKQVGELYLNSIDQDGTGQGYDFKLLEQVPSKCEIPLILAGGVGNGDHLLLGFEHPQVDAVATAHLFNFVGDGLEKVRRELLDQGKNLAKWSSIHEMSNKLQHN